jgi:hypothetical protein
LEKIRKHKIFIVLFFVLALSAYANQLSTISFYSDTTNGGSYFLKGYTALFSCNYSFAPTERVTFSSFLPKNSPIELIRLKQANLFAQELLQLNKTLISNTSASVPSILELNCVLRI